MVFNYFVKCQLKFIRFVCMQFVTRFLFTCKITIFNWYLNIFANSYTIHQYQMNLTAIMMLHSQKEHKQVHNHTISKFKFNIVPYQNKTMTSQSSSYNKK